jgi:mono/diheme cytochrome c family protein
MRKIGGNTQWLGGAVAAVALLLALTPAIAGESDPQDFTQIEKGRYLAVLGDCASCHTDPGGRPFAGGRAIETPFGNVNAPNITPDRDTGIGAWSDDQFDAAVRKGVRNDGALLYPAMPYNAYTKMSREDVIALRAYLNSVSPVRHAVVANALPFPFNIRAAMHVWNALYFKGGAYVPDPQKSAEWNRGAFLVEGPAHCGACHTPKTLLGGDKTGEYLRGSYLQGWFAPDITDDKTHGIGNWSLEEAVAYLKTGHNRVSAATGPMAEAVSLSTSHMTDADLTAIAGYLKSLPGRPDTAKPLPAQDPVMQAGAAIYRDECSACHALNGQGVPRLFPSVAESSVVRSDDPTTLIRIVLRGARSVATAAEPTSPGMPSYGWQLDDAQVAAVLTYIRNTWGAAAPAVSAQDVARERSHLASRPD